MKAIRSRKIIRSVLLLIDGIIEFIKCTQKSASKLLESKNKCILFGHKGNKSIVFLSLYIYIYVEIQIYNKKIELLI